MAYKEFTMEKILDSKLLTTVTFRNKRTGKEYHKEIKERRSAYPRKDFEIKGKGLR